MEFKLWFENQQYYFWVNRKGANLQPGTKLLPFKWQTGYPLWLAQEQLFEGVRKKIAPTAASRVTNHTHYVCDSLDHAKQWHGDIWKVNVNGKTYLADAEIWTSSIFRAQEIMSKNKRLQPLEIQELVEEVTYLAEDYWSRGGGSTPEVIVNGDVTLIERV
jgi:hypothetical protein